MFRLLFALLSLLLTVFWFIVAFSMISEGSTLKWLLRLIFG
jgi:hypothetical protein